MTPPTLPVLVCGSVDDGKSTLIGRLLTDCAAIPDDQRATDLAHITDGLEAEREQGITIDVAHRQFHTGRRRIRLLDSPGHEQYTRNMATAASQAELAIVLVDAVLGLRQQTRRHVRIARLMGVTTFIFVVNKMDLAGFDQARFRTLAADLEALHPGAITIPACATAGDNIARPGPDMPWHPGPTLLEALDATDTAPPAVGSFRMPVQLVLRGPAGERLLAGTVASGHVAAGDLVAVTAAAPAHVAAIHGPTGPQCRAEAGQAVTLTLAEPRDAGRGAVLSSPADPVPLADQFQAHLVWCDDAPLLPGRAYLFKLATTTVPGTITRIRHAVDPDTGLPLAATQLGLNGIGLVNLALATPTPYARFAENCALGAFIVIDRATGATLAAGVIDYALNRADNLAWQSLAVSPAARAALLGQLPVVAWFTGLSGAGKSTLANRVEAMLHARGRPTALLDGDNLRHGLTRDLGFTAADRVENVRRVAEVAALMADAGLIVLVCLISPYEADRAAARQRIGPPFLEIFVDADVAECRRRDPKGLYAKADRGEIPNFTGVSAPYEPPQDPDLHLRTAHDTIETEAGRVLHHILARCTPP